MPYVYSRPYVYSFGRIFQALHLFPALRLFIFSPQMFIAIVSSLHVTESTLQVCTSFFILLKVLKLVTLATPVSKVGD